jgi:hypothetical protein
MFALLVARLDPLPTPESLHGHGAEAPGTSGMFAAAEEAGCAAMIEEPITTTRTRGNDADARQSGGN